MNKIRYAFAICLLSIGFMQSAHATIVYGTAGTVSGSAGSSESFNINDAFNVEAGLTYKAMLTDTSFVLEPFFAKFDALFMQVLDDEFNVLGTVALAPGSSGMFDFTASADATYTVLLSGLSDATSAFAAKITAVPVPAAVWLMGTAMLGLLTVGRRKRA